MCFATSSTDSGNRRAWLGCFVRRRSDSPRGRPSLPTPMSLRLGDTPFDLPAGGLHNAYNAVSAIAAAHVLGIDQLRSLAALEGFRTRFGRAEELRLGDIAVWLALIKNPAGAGAVAQQLA